MKYKINASEFIDHVDSANNDFSRDGLLALYEYLEAEHSGEYLLDVLELLGQYSEYETAAAAVAGEYGYKDGEAGDDEEEILEWLKQQGAVIEFDGGIIIECN